MPVIQSALYLINNTELLDVIDILESSGLIISCICHDLGHSGTSN